MPKANQQIIEEKIKKLFKDWSVDKIDNLMSHLNPIIKEIKEDSERRGRSYVYKILEEALSTQESALKVQWRDEIDKNKKKHDVDCIHNDDGYGYKFSDCNNFCQVNGYNQALEDLKKL